MSNEKGSLRYVVVGFLIRIGGFAAVELAVIIYRVVMGQQEKITYSLYTILPFIVFYLAYGILHDLDKRDTRTGID